MSYTDKEKFPIGQWQEPQQISDQELDAFIKIIKDFPGKIKGIVENWTDEQLDAQYRKKGWRVRQLINHLSDMSMSSYFIFKLALTEDNPTAFSFNEQKWAELQDSFSIEIKPALQILKGVHKRWVYELKALTNKEFESTFYHPTQQREFNLRTFLAYCAWHCEHHLAHLQLVKNAYKW